jgi:hypothetical protein
MPSGQDVRVQAERTGREHPRRVPAGRSNEVNRARTIALRVAFAAALVLLPLELVVQRVASQPYPGVYQPSFAGTPLVGDTLTARVPIVQFAFSDGTTRDVPFEEVLPESKLLAMSVFKSAFFEEGRANDPATVGYLRDLLQEKFPGSEPATMTVEWTSQKIDIRDPDDRPGTVTKTIVVDLSGDAR